MTQSLLDYIHKQEKKLFDKKASFLLRVAIYGWLFLLYIVFAAHRALYLLFAPASRSFTLHSDQSKTGTYSTSYHRHVELQRGLRFFSLSTMLMIVLSSVALLSVMQIVFPPSETEQAQAADNTYTVITNNNLGPGSLRTAITNANAAVGSVEIVFDIVGTNEITLATALPDLTAAVTFTNNEIAPVRIDGSSLAGGTDCWTIASGAEGSTVVGLAFVDCPENGLVVSANSITIGGSAAKDNVYAYGNGANGIQLDGSSHTLEDVFVGWPLVLGGTDGNTGDGLYIAGSNTSVDGVVALQNGDDGIEIAAGASNVTIENSYIGVRDSLSTSAIGNTGNGIEVGGNNATIGGATSGNVIGGNNRYGISVTPGVDTVTIQGNTIGLNGDEDATRSNAFGGMRLESADNITVTGNTISANTGPNISIDGGANLTMTSNYIGTTSANVDFGSQAYGIRVQNAASNVTIGGSSTSDGNTIAYNDGGGVHLATSGLLGVLISHNTFTSNDGDAIEIETGANDGIAAPTVDGAGSPAITGTATAGNSVEVYADGVFIGEETTVPASGEWELTAAEASVDDFDAYNGDDITALQIDSSDNTSEFSSAATLTTTAATLTVTESQTFTSSLDVTATVDGGGTLYYTTDGSTPTTSSTSAESPLSFTVTDTTELNIFGEDTNNNLTDVTTATYTNSADADSGDTDGGDGDGSNDGSNDGIGSNPITVDYLQSENITVNGVNVGDGSEPLYTPVDGITIKGDGADTDHQVRVGVERKKTGNEVDNKWVEVNDNGIWKRTVGEDLKKGVKYNVVTRARKNDRPKTNSKQYSVATIIPSNPAPTIATLTGDVTVTAQPDELNFGGVFQGKYDKATFRVQNERTGKIAASCVANVGNESGATKSGSCALDTTLAPGDYRVLFHSVDDELLSAPDDARLTVTPGVARSTLNLDSRSDNFDYRITTSASPTVVGIGPENATARVYVDGKLQGNATYTSDISWEYALDLGGTALGDHEIVVKFFTDRTNELSGDRILFPFKYAAAPVDLRLSGSVPSEITAGAGLSATIVGGEGDLVTMKQNGVVTGSFNLDVPLGNNLAQKSVLLPTTSTGQQSIVFTSSNSIGLESSPLQIVYSVVAGSGSGAVNTEETTEETEVEETEEVVVEEISQEIIEDSETETVELSDGTVIDLDEIPAQWLTPPQSDEERVEIKERLKQFNTTQIAITATATIRDENGNVIEEAPVEKSAEGVTVLRQIRTSGIDYVLPWFGAQEEQQTIEFSGITDPYAQVKLTVRSDPIVQFDRADETGEWTMNVSVASLPPGEHSAYVQTESKGVTSDEVEIAKFVVVEEERISTTTWIFIVNILVIIIFLLVAVALQFRHRMKQMDKYSTPPVAKKGDALASMKDAAKLETIAKATENQN